MQNMQNMQNADNGINIYVYVVNVENKIVFYI